MAFDYSNPEGKVSQWNEAMFKMKRLHELQTEINRCKMDLLSKHFMNQRYNYEIWYSSILALYSEGEAKYKENEKIEIAQIQNLIDHFLKFQPVHVPIKKVSYAESKQSTKVNYENWERLKRLITLLESRVKFYNDEHGLSTANVESMDGTSILR